MSLLYLAGKYAKLVDDEKIVDGHPQMLARVHALVGGKWTGKIAGSPDWLSFENEGEALAWLKVTSLGIVSSRLYEQLAAQGVVTGYPRS